jgi:hypothetical protein
MMVNTVGYSISQTLPLINWLFEGQYQHFWENTLVMDTTIMLEKAMNVVQTTTEATASNIDVSIY